MFDWDNYCISLKGPVRISASPEIAAEKSPNSHDLLLGDDFLGYCLKMLSVPMRGGNGFPLKHLNIIDPLKDNNNVGCSINKANSIRIRSAFSYGARKLGQVLVAQEDTIADELHKFFSNTTILLAGEQRRDIQDPESLSTGSGAQTRSSTGNGLSGNEYSKEGEDVSNLRVQDLKISEASVNASASGFLDLSGDLSYHLACLGHARRWCAYAKAPPGLPPPFPHLINMRAMKHAHRVADFKSDRFHHGGMNGGIVLCPEFHPLNQLLMPRPPFLEGPGSMTYLPEMVLPVDRASNGPVTSPRGLHFLVGHGNGAKVLDAPHKGLNPNANMSIPLPEPVDQLVPVRPSMPFGEALLPAQLMHRPRPCFRKHRFRVQPRNHLIEEDDSRPLSV